MHFVENGGYYTDGIVRQSYVIFALKLSTFFYERGHI